MSNLKRPAIDDAPTYRPSRVNRQAGSTTWARMKAHGFKNAEERQRDFDNLQLKPVAPSQRATQERWLSLFEGYRDEVLGVPESSPPTALMLVSFMEAYLSSAPGPLGYEGVRLGLWYLVRESQFRYPDFHDDSHFYAALAAFLSTAFEQERLILGPPTGKCSAGFATAARMSTAYVNARGPTLARMSDGALQALLATVLVSTLSCRIGDVALTPGYDNERCLHFSDVKISVDPSYRRQRRNNSSAVTGQITLRAEKGHKRQNSGRIIPVGMLPGHPNMCLLTVLHTIAVRRGMLPAGSDLPTTLTLASHQSDHRVHWLNDGPILVRPDGSAATPGYLRVGLLDMVSVSGVQKDVTFHAFRRGGARDINHLPAAELDAAGFLHPATRQVLGHTKATELNDITERYGGSYTKPMMPIRARHSNTAQHLLQFSPPAVVPNEPDWGNSMTGRDATDFSDTDDEEDRFFVDN